MYLKRKYGEGYNLIIELKSISDENELRQQQQTVIIYFINLYYYFFVYLEFNK
jgi:hypothetical protein